MSGKYYHMARYAAEIAVFLEDLELQNTVPFEKLSFIDARKQFENLQTQMNISLPVAQVESCKIPAGIEGETTVYIVKPTGAVGRLPGLFYLHGGGWLMGSFLTHERLIKELAVETGCVIFFIDYALTPEANYPVQFQQCKAVMSYVREHSSKFSVDENALSLGGDGAGGNLALSLALQCLDDRDIKLSSLILLCPALDADMVGESHRIFSDTPWMNHKAWKWFWSVYAESAEARQDMYVSPMRAKPGELRGLPATLLLTAECDVLCSEGEAFARKMMKAEIPVTAVRFNGMIHDFMVLNALHGLPSVRSAIELTASYLRQNWKKSSKYFKQKRILMIVTSHEELGDTGKATGLWLEEFAAPYHRFFDAGFELVTASPAGGLVPVDPVSLQPENLSEDTSWLQELALSPLTNAKKLSLIDPALFDAVFFPGGHGPMWDLFSDKESLRILKNFIDKNRLIGAVCHGPAALLNAAGSDGKLLLAGKRCTGFSNREEELVGLTQTVPFLLEDRLKAVGGDYSSGAAPWEKYIVQDGKLVTGENPASSDEVAKAMIQILEG